MSQTIAHFFSLYRNVPKLYTIHETPAHLCYHNPHFWRYRFPMVRGDSQKSVSTKNRLYYGRQSKLGGGTDFLSDVYRWYPLLCCFPMP